LSSGAVQAGGGSEPTAELTRRCAPPVHRLCTAFYNTRALRVHCVCTACALRVHCVCCTCILPMHMPVHCNIL